MAYTATVTVDFPQPKQLPRFGEGVISGTVTISEYNSTLAEITGITKYFKRIHGVAPMGVTTSGYPLNWDNSEKAFKAFKGDYSASIDGPLVEASDGTNLGSVKFLAFGIAK